MTNTITLITIVLTNWVNIPGTRLSDGGTNYTKQRLVVITNTYVEEVSLCTNRTFYKSSGSVDTNAPVRWEQVPTLNLIPGQFSKQ